MLWFDTSKKTAATPITRATAYMCQMLRTPSSASTGSAARASARTASATIMTCRLRMRSIQAPAGSPTTRNAATVAALRTPTSHSVACRMSTASTGMASSVICAPNWLSACPPHRVRKLRSRHSEPLDAGDAAVGAASASMASSAPARDVSVDDSARASARIAASSAPSGGAGSPTD